MPKAGSKRSFALSLINFEWFTPVKWTGFQFDGTMAMSVSPRISVALMLALLLQACTTTGPQQPDKTTEATPSYGRAQSQRIPATAPVGEKADAEFKGPQVVFSQDSSEVPRSAGPMLDDIASKLKADPLVNVVLVGHTEDLGSTEFSMAVASKCTQAVGQALIKRGARPSQIRMQPRGREQITAKRCTGNACKKQMRRVDIVMSDY
jgi:outer membrane protein OmpA-like peptidoglycan-associated protein